MSNLRRVFQSLDLIVWFIDFTSCLVLITFTIFSTINFDSYCTCTDYIWLDRTQDLPLLSLFPLDRYELLYYKPLKFLTTFMVEV